METNIMLENPPPLLADDLRQYLRLIGRWSWLILLAAFLAGLSAFIVSQQMQPVYQASTTIIVSEAPATQVGEAYTALLTSQRLAQTYAEMMVKKPVLNEVVANLELAINLDDLHDMITVQSVRDTQLIDVAIEDTNPQRAADIANEIVVVFGAQNQAMQEARYASTKERLMLQLEEIQQKIAEFEASIAALGESEAQAIERSRLELSLIQSQQTYTNTMQSYEQVNLAEVETISNVVQVEIADAPEIPIRPRILMNTALASVVGAMMAVGSIFLIEALDDTIRNIDQVNQILKLPVLGMIRKMEESDAPITAVQPRAPASEDFRSLRTNIQFASVDYPLTTILVTSPTPGDGKTTVAINLSIILAQSGKKITLLDTDLRRPRIHHQLKISNRWGLTSLFMNEDIYLESVLRKNNSTGLTVITSGVLPPNPAELLASDKMYQLISNIKTESDVVIFDSPPLTAVTDAAVLSKHVDGVILVLSLGRTRLAAAQQAVKQLQQVGANILGVVVNNIRSTKSPYHYVYASEYSDENYFRHKPENKIKAKPANSRRREVSNVQ